MKKLVEALRILKRLREVEANLSDAVKRLDGVRDSMRPCAHCGQLHDVALQRERSLRPMTITVNGDKRFVAVCNECEIPVRRLGYSVMKSSPPEPKETKS